MPVVVQSAAGRLEVLARVTGDVPAGTVFMPSGYNDAPVNTLLTEDAEIVGVRVSRGQGSGVRGQQTGDLTPDP